MTVEDKKTLKLCEKKVELYSASQPSPLVIYHAVMGEGNALWQACKKINCPMFSLAVINGVKWDDDMTPWPIPAISKRDTPCLGKADIYLEQLTNKIMPQIIAKLPYAPTYCALAGYSLAGLFSVYAAFKTDCFSRIVSASGSLWYPNLIPYVQQNHISEQVKVMYFSLGDRESHTKNQYLAPVEKNTEFLAQYFSDSKIQTVFELNSGNHYHNSAGRTAKGIKWMLQQS